MFRFNVLERQQNIHRSYLLEASAGTGKTFSIENIIVRLLLEDGSKGLPLTLEQILVVTFTRAATRDLKQRSRLCIEKALDCLHGNIQSAPDYLIAYMEKGQECIELGKRRLEQALLAFDQAQIFTIHGFCSQMLRDNIFEGDVGIGSISQEDISLNAQILKVIRDYFRTELRPESYTPKQLQIISNAYRDTTSELEQAVLKLINSGYEIDTFLNATEQLDRFSVLMTALKKQYDLKSEYIVEDFVQQAPAYEKLCSKNQQVKSEILEIIENFAMLFDKNSWSFKDWDILMSDGLKFVEAIDPSKLKATGKPPAPDQLHYPNLTLQLRQSLLPLVSQSRNPSIILARIAKGCQQLQRRYFTEEEIVNYDDLLKAMLQAIQDPRFAEGIRKRYKAAIIDEFQDTDPIQWEIFQTLFMSQKWGHLYLVGDPKQSIYAFRQADIYTYLAAADAMGKENHASLDTNFRSQHQLVEALNALFDPVHTPDLISLPRIDKNLPYKPVQANFSIVKKPFKDSHGSIHFCIAPLPSGYTAKKFPLEEYEGSLFPYFASEINRLHTQEGIPLRQCAILVSDRFQAQRLASFLENCHIPFHSQRATNLLDSLALPALRELLIAILHPKQESLLKTGLGGPIIGWTHEKIKELALEADHRLLEEILNHCYCLRQIWLEQGFANFFNHLLKSSWYPSKQTVAEKLLSFHGGASFYDELQQLANILMKEEYQLQLSPEGFITYLDELAVKQEKDETKFRKQTDATQDAVPIITMHSSKGLEFEVVFALGLISRTRVPDDLIPIRGNNCVQLSYVESSDTDDYIRHCDELDAEKMRQLYVVMTRAKQRLYAPVALTAPEQAPERGCASPMELLLARIGQTCVTPSFLYQCLQGYDASNLLKFIESIKEHVSITNQILAGSEQSPIQKPVQQQCSLQQPPHVEIPEKRLFMHSFTTLTKDHAAGVVDVATPPQNYHAGIKSRHNLPAGSETGTLLHRILETLSFHVVREMSHADQLIPYISPILKNSRLADWDIPVSQMLFDVLTAPLMCGESEFQLCHLSEDHYYKELEFMYPISQMDHENWQGIEGLTASSGFLKGIIDLVFRYKDKYYLLDWKSNWLGPSSQSYDQHSMLLAMEAHRYFIQANIYTIALQRYLKLVDPRPFKEIFGGTFYLFLRGLSPHQSTGIFKVQLQA